MSHSSLIAFTFFSTNSLLKNSLSLSLTYIGLYHSNREWYRPNLKLLSLRTASASSAVNVFATLVRFYKNRMGIYSQITSLCKPISTEFQLNEYLDGHKANPSSKIKFDIGTVFRC